MSLRKIHFLKNIFFLNFFETVDFLLLLTNIKDLIKVCLEFEQSRLRDYDKNIVGYGDGLKTCTDCKQR